MALRDEMRSQGNFLFKHRGQLPVLIIVVGLTVYVQGQMSGPTESFLTSRTYEGICIAVSLMGLLIRILSVGYSADHTSGRNTSAGQIAETINNTGFYSMLRHPLYLGNFFMWLGIAGFTQNLWFIIAFVFLYWLYYERIMYAEEAFLIDTYGEGYTNYSKQTPAFLPSFKNYRPPNNTFSWRKIIRQEKAGILNLCVVIFAFKFIGTYLTEGTILSNKFYWGILAFGLMWYVLIKGIQSGTSMLAVDRP